MLCSDEFEYMLFPLTDCKHLYSNEMYWMEMEASNTVNCVDFDGIYTYFANGVHPDKGSRGRTLVSGSTLFVRPVYIEEILIPSFRWTLWMVADNNGTLHCMNIYVKTPQDWNIDQLMYYIFISM